MNSIANGCYHLPRVASIVQNVFNSKRNLIRDTAENLPYPLKTDEHQHFPSSKFLTLEGWFAVEMGAVGRLVNFIFAGDIRKFLQKSLSFCMDNCYNCMKTCMDESMTKNALLVIGNAPTKFKPVKKT